ncbi:MAG: terpene cyclase/mutase family protein [Planctomycetes bacterium]|nr:terpene cyclase/mutase family protein [Planctomycetota bacterium]
MNLLESVQHVAHDSVRQITQRKKEWNFSKKKTSLDVVNHVFRVLTQEDAIQEHLDAAQAMTRCQHESGGWGEFSNDPEDKIREAAFCVRNLVRANRRFRNPDVAESVRRGVRYLLQKQMPDGSWFDPLWGQSDATSISLGALIFARHERIFESETHSAVERGIQFAAGMQSEDGGWYDPRFKQEVRLSPVAWTAHILPKVVVYRGESETSRKGLRLLAQNIGENGAWDKDDVDHTCDAGRALILGCIVLQERAYSPLIEQAIAWLLQARNSDGLWGPKPGARSNLLMSCDVFDTFQKYRLYLREQRLTREQLLDRYDDF